MTTTPQRSPARTLPLLGTSKKTATDRDSASLAALHYAQAWAITHADETSPPTEKGLSRASAGDVAGPRKGAP
jgi:hypothetical protein